MLCLVKKLICYHLTDNRKRFFTALGIFIAQIAPLREHNPNAELPGCETDYSVGLS